MRGHLGWLILGHGGVVCHEQKAPLRSTEIAAASKFGRGAISFCRPHSKSDGKAWWRNVGRIGVKDVVRGNRVCAAGENRLEQVDLLVEKSQLDQVGLPRGAGQLGVTQEPQPAIAGSQGQVGHQADLLGLHAGLSPGGRHVFSPDVLAHDRRRRDRDPRPVERTQLGKCRQTPPLVQKRHALDEVLPGSPEQGLNADRVEVARRPGEERQVAVDDRGCEV